MTFLLLFSSISHLGFIFFSVTVLPVVYFSLLQPGHHLLFLCSTLIVCVVAIFLVLFLLRVLVGAVVGAVILHDVDCSLVAIVSLRDLSLA